MTPEQKAKELVDKFIEPTMYWDEIERESLANIDAAKQCALIAVDEILNLLFQHHEIDFWKQVKEEINKL